jgi:hypothetical protein
VNVPPEDDAENLSPRRHHRRLAVANGFSVYADASVHENDRVGLERLSRADDGRPRPTPLP